MSLKVYPKSKQHGNGKQKAHFFNIAPNHDDKVYHRWVDWSWQFPLSLTLIRCRHAEFIGNAMGLEFGFDESRLDQIRD